MVKQKIKVFGYFGDNPFIEILNINCLKSKRNEIIRDIIYKKYPYFEITINKAVVLN